MSSYRLPNLLRDITKTRQLIKQMLTPGSVKAEGIWAGYSADALALSRVVDASISQLNFPQQNPDKVNSDRKKRVCNWFIPPFDNPFYGGIRTIIEFAAYLEKTHGMRQRFVICGSADQVEIERLIRLAAPDLTLFESYILDSVIKIENIPEADYGFATLWTTAYVLLGVRNCGLKLYFVQDFEPLFYPAGSTYGQALSTYKFGFHIVANTSGVLDSIPIDSTTSRFYFTPQVDHSIFHSSNRVGASAPMRVFYYARPGHPRNAFELGVAALSILKSRLKDSVEIVCAGAEWNPSDYGLQGAVTSIGMLPFKETGNLYRSCHVGLSMMFTRHPSYLPFELMACGCTVVANRNDANSWFFRDRANCFLSESTATSIAETLELAVSHWEDHSNLRNTAISDANTLTGGGWSNEYAAIFRHIESLHVNL
jgi:O-antigen biosynthesis protein